MSSNSKSALSRVSLPRLTERTYEHRNSFGKTYGEHKRALELERPAYHELKTYAEAQGLIFMASAWDEESVDFLEELGVPAHKVASADLTNLPLLAYMAQTGKPILLSTGMSNLNEVDQAMNTLRTYTDQIVVLQCTSTYPSEFDQINLRVIPAYRERYQTLVGYSGHEKGIAIPVGAVALGACVVERHFTLDRTMKGGDHAASLEPTGLMKMVRDIRALEQAMGDGVKHIYNEEWPIRHKLAKSVVTAVSIPPNTPITRAMLTTKGPGNGISAARMQSLIGLTTTHHIPADTVLQESDIAW